MVVKTLAEKSPESFKTALLNVTVIIFFQAGGIVDKMVPR